MRSRYSAHMLLGQGQCGYGDYLASTWLMAVELGLSAASFAGHTVNWQKLEVLNATQYGDLGEVEFNAYFYADASPRDQMQVHHERSLFRRIQGTWYYVEAKA
jgi:SEC-C motif-containing protein